MTPITMYDHLRDSQSDILSLLHAHLPVCLPLYRRIQFQNFTPDSHLLCSLSPEDLQAGENTDKPWIAAYIDRSRRPETEVWLAGSWESQTTTEENAWLPQAEELTRALVADVAKIVVSGSEPSPQTLSGAVKDQSSAAETNGSKNSANKVHRAEYEGHMKNTSICVFGAVHERTVTVLQKIGALAEGYVGANIPYQKYIFDLSDDSASKPSPRDLPSDLAWGEVQPQHYAMVRSRTMIPRQDSTLAQLPSLALYPKGKPDPISWAFLGPDSALATLHVEPEYRGRGLAKLLSAKLFAERMNVFWNKEVVDGDEERRLDRWAHADVAIDNGPSNAVCKGLSGQATWNVYWVRVDLARE